MNQFHPTINRLGRSIGWLTAGDKIYLASQGRFQVDQIGIFVPGWRRELIQAEIDGRLRMFECFELTPSTAHRLKRLADDIVQLIFDIPEERQLELMLSSSRDLEPSK